MIDNGRPFTVAISSQDVPAGLLASLVTRILSTVGGTSGAWPALTAAVHDATDVVASDRSAAGGAHAGHRLCQVEFRAAGGSLDVVVSSHGRRVLQASRPIPARTDDAPL